MPESQRLELQGTVRDSRGGAAFRLGHPAEPRQQRADRLSRRLCLTRRLELAKRTAPNEPKRGSNRRQVPRASRIM
jgi:hypothetical protein